jgi:SAM-dependent methyltransferase
MREEAPAIRSDFAERFRLSSLARQNQTGKAAVDLYLDSLLDARTDDVGLRMSSWAWREYPNVVKEIICGVNAAEALEVGGGRSPLFSHDEARSLRVSYTSNDISQDELDLAPAWVGRARFDIQTPDRKDLAQFEGRYDVIFSKMVMEHVASYERAYTNISRLLKPGGIAIAFNPTLFTLPFVLNYVLPDATTRRAALGHPKFPAYYSGCMVSERIEDRIRSFGFRRVHQLPFYGHGYYEKLPVVRECHKLMTDIFARSDLKLLSAYSYTFAVK